VIQTLFSSTLIAEALPELWESDPEEGRQALDALRLLNRSALAEMRTLLMELRPASLVETTLGDLLHLLGEAVTGRTGIPVTVSVTGLCDLPGEVHLALYRIAQEALANVVKYAAASEVSVTLACAYSPSSIDKQGHKRVELGVKDDGRGFAPDGAEPDQSWSHRPGLSRIREWARSIGANLWIRSKPRAGTEVTVVWQEKEET
jgi:two-component system nitrate/nitrite sensor histidine kinase NarX